MQLRLVLDGLAEKMNGQRIDVKMGDEWERKEMDRRQTFSEGSPQSAKTHSAELLGGCSKLVFAVWTNNMSNAFRWSNGIRVNIFTCSARSKKEVLVVYFVCSERAVC